MVDLLQSLRVRVWLLIVGVSTLLIGASYAMAQQANRLSAYDLPLAQAQTVHHELTNGAAPKDVIPSIKTDLANDSTPFTIITDSFQHVLASSAQLNGQTPLPPSGTFDYTKAHAGDRFTWQPASSVRLAIEMLPYGTASDGGFIIAGQSLRQAEDRVNIYGEIALAAWLGVIIWTSVSLFWPTPTKKLKK